MKRLGTICARGGSKGVPGKNLRPLLGRPLIAYSIAQAQASGLFDAIAVSSDSAAILETAERYGASILIERPASLATDNAAKLPVLRHCLEECERRLATTFDIHVDLDATSPLRLPSDIVDAVRLLEVTGCSNVITGAPARRSPYFNLVELDERGFVQLSKTPPGPVVRRQDAPPCFDMNASIYVWWRDRIFDGKVFYEDTRLLVMPEERSIDIDSELDFAIVEMLIRRSAPGWMYEPK